MAGSGRLTGRVLQEGTELRSNGPLLITGAAGFVGQHLLRLWNLGEGDFACDLTDDFPAPPGVRRVAWQLPGPAPRELGACAWVVHAAAISSVGDSGNALGRLFEVNVLGAASVMEYVSERCPGARVLLLGSSDSYGDAASDDPAALISEDAPFAPINAYGSSKAAAEIVCMQLARANGLDLVASRSFPHFGPGQRDSFAVSAFCKRIVEAVRTDAGVVRVGNLAPVRDYLHIDDVCRAYAVLLARGEALQAYNVCSGTGVSIGDILDILVDIAGGGLEITTCRDLARSADIRAQIGDCSRLRSLGWENNVRLRDGLEALLSWWEDEG